MDDLIADFLAETNESMGELDNDLVNLEQNPDDKDLLGKIFRLVHTIKGTCGFLGLPRLEKVAHHGENVLGRFRDGDLKVTPEYVSLIFESFDVIRGIIEAIEETGAEPEGDDSALIAKLDAAYESNDEGGGEVSAPAAEVVMEEAPQAETTKEPEEELPVGMVSEADLEAAFAAAELPADLVEKRKKQNAAKEPAAETAKKPANESAPKNAEDAAEKKEAAAIAQTLRVNVDALENLMTMVSELVLTRNQLLQILRNQDDSEFSTPLQRLNHVVSDLQEGVMKTRMQPIGNAWAKLPRIIRDLGMELEKKINLEMHGEETELDRQVLELIKDPLTHMVRNSGDHGIETPVDRRKAGKPETGTITLEAFHEGGHIIIKITDDGKGLSAEKIKKKALENGLATESELAEMSAQQINQFIFRAGFSTAEKITSVSGRGVGMDVVRTNIEKIGGSIELHSEEGKGSSFTIKIPLTLAIVSALIVEAAGERFAIPQLCVRELVMTSDQGENRIENIKGTPVFRLRDHLLPLVRLDELLKLERVAKDAKPDSGQEEHPEINDNLQPEKSRADTVNKYIIVTQVGTYNFGIIVDRVFDTEEIVVKPVATILRNIELFSGNTILGDGSVIMILDPNGIARATDEMEASDKAGVSVKEENSLLPHTGDTTSLLIFAAGSRTPKAVPLSLVARLENVKTEDIEYSGGQMMVQYRGGLMPLLPFDGNVSMESAEGNKPVLVFTDRERSMGLVVDEIIDIKEEQVDVQVETNQQGLMGSAIIDGKATDVMDVGYFLKAVSKDWFKNHGDEPFESAKPNGAGNTNGKPPKTRILLVDDSPFFRNMITPLLNIEGYDVTPMESAVDALKLCDDGAYFDLIISDIEMPEMDGFQFAEKIKDGSSWQETPIVALTSHTNPQDIDRGKSVGFNKYVPKFDRDTLLSTISKTLYEQSEAA